MKFSILLVLGLILSVANAHMSIYVRSMWGSEPSNGNSNWAVNPLQDYTFAEWWMHGPKSLNDPPPANQITQLPAGGTIDFEIGTNKAFTSMGQGLWKSPGKTSRVPPSPWKNEGSEWPSNLHAVNRTDTAGCAIGIAYKSNINDVKPEDFVIISVVKDCPARALQAFDIPYIPSCPNGKCICSWFWTHLSSGGTDQMYMTPFQCTVTNPSTRTIGVPKPPTRCDGQPACYLNPSWGTKTTVCPKPLQPLYWSNKEKNNIANPTGQQCAPIYSKEYGYPDGAQHTIFTDTLSCPAGNVGDTLKSLGGTAQIGSSPATVLTPPSCKTRLVVQGDGNVVLYDVANGKVYWASGSNGKGGTAPYRLVIQQDGNLVLLDSKNVNYWSSATNGKQYACAPYQLKLRDVNKLTVVDCNGEPLWTAPINP